jgi:hypothetical protein
MARPPERYDPANIRPPSPYDGVKLLVDYGNRKKTRLPVFEARYMDRVSTVENQPRVAKIKAVFFDILLPFHLVPFKHSTL